jgi:cytochrome c-type protein NapC
MSENQGVSKKSGFFAMLRRPSVKYSLFTLLGGGFLAGIIFVAGFNTAMDATNTLDFCISCHEMKDNVYQEYKKTIHYSNRSGVRVTCPDCHVPKDFGHKMMRKIQASKEVYGRIVGTIDTKEKFEANRLRLAESEWARMKKVDSQECRNCHKFDAMDTSKQKMRSLKQHENAQRDKQSCVDCHKGIAHELPEGMKEEY